MALKGKKPEAVQKRLKMMIFGPAGVGKTTFSLQFPDAYFIDTERGAENDQYVRRMQEAGALYLQSCDAEEVIEELRQLVQDPEDRKTLVIDPITTIYDHLLDKNAERYGLDYGKYKHPSDMRMKHIFNLLYRLDMNVILTSHAKENWVSNKDHRGREVREQQGMTFDGYKKLDYIFDMVIGVEKRGRDRIAKVTKSRVESMPEGDEFEFSFDLIADRYGRDIICRDSSGVTLATPEQVAHLEKLLRECMVDEDKINKWLDKHNAHELSEIPATAMAQAIEHYQQQAEMAKKGAA